MTIKPKLGLFDTTMAVVSLVIGIGIFRTPSIVAQKTGTVEIFFAAWLLGGILSLMGGLIYAEIGSRKPMPGGFYKIVSEMFHPAFAFMINWLYTLIVAGAGFSAVTLLGSEYIQPLLGISNVVSSSGKIIISGVQLIALGVIIFLFIINYIGIKMGAIVVNILTVIKISMILLFSIVAFFISSPHEANTSISDITPPQPSMFSALWVGLIAVFYCFGGYHVTINLGADVNNPKRNMPWGIIFGVIIIFSLYLSINIGYVKLLGFENIKNSPLIAADMANAIFGDIGKKLISIIIFSSVLGFLNISLLQIPRTYHAMADDKVLPAIFSRTNSKTQVQEFALIFFTCLCIFFIFFLGTFASLLNVIIFIDTLIIAIVAGTIFILRRHMRNTSYDGYKVPLYPVIPILFILFLLSVSASAFIEAWGNSKSDAILLIILILLGYPLYYLLRKIIKQKPQQ